MLKTIKRYLIKAEETAAFV